jgi:hypothetical protein
MLSLPSSGEHRTQQAKRRLVLDIFLRRGAAWERVRAIRERWGIEAQAQMPPSSGGIGYFPDSVGPPPEDQFGKQRERWQAKYYEWMADLSALCYAAVPEGARDSKYPLAEWQPFLSMCVCFDPPETQLEKFVEKMRWTHSNVVPRAGGPSMHNPPIVWLRDGSHAEEAMMEFYEGLVAALCEQYVHPQGVTTEDAIRSVRKQNPEIFDRLGERLRANESRPYIDVTSYHTQKDIESAFRILSARHEERPVPGPKKRDELTAVQCAILHDRHGWKYERIAEEYGWSLGSNVVSKYIGDGRHILAAP